jgi:urease accessory protein
VTPGRGSAEATIHLVAEADGPRVRLVTMRSAFPVALRRTGPERVHLVGTGAWPLGGDHVRLCIEVGPGASLEVAAVAANVALPGRGGQPSVSEVQVDVAAGGRLRLDLGPTIVAAGADHRASVDVRLGVGAGLALREFVVLGREHEPGGRSAQRLDVCLDGAALIRDEAVRPHPHAARFVDGGARAVGSVVLVDGRVRGGPGAGPDGASAGRVATGVVGAPAEVGEVLALPGGRGWRAVALGDDVAAVGGWLASCWAVAAGAGAGAQPSCPGEAAWPSSPSPSGP